jgi:L-propargylglycine--L-glutamate ligase
MLMGTGLTRVVLYSMNYAERILHELEYVRFSAERGLCHLAELRQDDTRLIVLMSVPVHEDVLEYHFRDLYRLDETATRSAYERLTVLTPQSTAPSCLDSLALADTPIMDRLRSEAKAGHRLSISNFMPSASAAELARTFDAAVDEGCWQLSSRWGGKIGSRELLAVSGVDVPRGAPEPVHDVAGAAAAVQRLAEGAGGPRRALIKLDDPSWAGAVGNVVVEARLVRGPESLATAAGALHQPWDAFVQELAKGAVVEELIEDVTSSPSGVGEVAADGTVRLRGIQEQILDLGQYWGCRFPAGEELRGQVAEATAWVGDALAGLGYEGTFGVDFVATSTGRLVGVEVNLRKVGPSYVLTYLESLAGKRTDPDGVLRVGGSAVHYLHRRLNRPEVLLGQRPRTAVERLREADLLYRRETGSGVLLHMLGALPTCGFVELTSVGTSDEAAATIDRAAQARILRA